MVQDLKCEKGRIVASLSCFVILWIEYPVLIYVNNKFCNQNLGFDLYYAVLNVSGFLLSVQILLRREDRRNA